MDFLYEYESLDVLTSQQCTSNCTRSIPTQHFATFAAIGDHRSTQTLMITQYLNEHLVFRKMLGSFIVVYNNGLRLLRKLYGPEGDSRVAGGARVEAQ